MGSSDRTAKFNANAWADAWISSNQEHSALSHTSVPPSSEENWAFLFPFLFLHPVVLIHMWNGYSKNRPYERHFITQHNIKTTLRPLIEP